MINPKLLRMSGLNMLRLIRFRSKSSAMAGARWILALMIALGTLMLFPGEAHPHVSGGRQALAIELASQGFLCKECMEVTSEAQEFLSDPGNLDSATDFVKAYACESIVPEYKNKCKDTVDEYVPVVFSALQDYLSPEKMCLETGLCNAIEFPTQEATTCTVCKSLTSEATSLAKSHRSSENILSALGRACFKYGTLQDECNSVVEQYGSQILSRSSDRSFCMAAKLCKAPPTRNNCALCQYLVKEIKVKLQDPETQEKLLEFLIDNCQKLHNHVDECKLLVLEYGPQVLANLDTLLDDQVCSKIGMCPGGKGRDEPLAV